MPLRLFCTALLATAAAPAFAFNALGHKVVAEIAWRGLSRQIANSLWARSTVRQIPAVEYLLCLLIMPRKCHEA